MVVGSPRLRRFCSWLPCGLCLIDIPYESEYGEHDQRWANDFAIHEVDVYDVRYDLGWEEFHG